MCDICRHMPCLSGCPNEEEPEEITVCESCGEEICVGDRYCVIENGAYCEACIDDMSKTELMMLLGINMLTAEAGDWSEAV